MTIKSINKLFLDHLEQFFFLISNEGMECQMYITLEQLLRGCLLSYSGVKEEHSSVFKNLELFTLDFTRWFCPADDGIY